MATVDLLRLRRGRVTVAEVAILCHVWLAHHERQSMIELLVWLRVKELRTYSWLRLSVHLLWKGILMLRSLKMLRREVVVRHHVA